MVPNDSESGSRESVNTDWWDRNSISLQQNSAHSSVGPRSSSSIQFLQASRIIMGEITVEKKLGTGHYGAVYLGKWQDAPVALKN